MKRPTPSASLRFAVPLLAATFVTGPALACMQGYKINPAPSLDELLKRRPVAPNLEMPRMAPLPVAALSLSPEKPAVKVLPLGSPDGIGHTGATAKLAAYVRKFEAGNAAAASFEDTMDYAVALVRVGRVADAIAVLHRLEARRPGVYMTAANLGTAYELAGNLEAAVQWIAEDIQRDRAGHAGTEWLHLAILQAKIKLRGDPAWLAEHSVLDGTAVHAADEILRAIDYQLGERLEFVTPADATVCDLFYQAAKRVSGPDAKERRAFYLRESLRFGDWRKREIGELARG